MSNDPEWKWELKGWVPKKDMLKIYSPGNTFTWNTSDMEDFKDRIKDNKVDEVALVRSTIYDISFNEQENMSLLFTQGFLEYKEKIGLKNKEIYIFNVVD